LLYYHQMNKFGYSDADWQRMVDDMRRPFDFAIIQGWLVVMGGEMDGCVSDGISYPWFLRPLFNRFKKPYVYSAVRHDKVYIDHSYPRAVADSLFRDSLIEDKMNPILANTHYYLVRWFGWRHWKDDYHG
jgi:hypothetical protein